MQLKCFAGKIKPLFNQSQPAARRDRGSKLAGGMCARACTFTQVSQVSQVSEDKEVTPASLYSCWHDHITTEVVINYELVELSVK